MITHTADNVLFSHISYLIDKGEPAKRGGRQFGAYDDDPQSSGSAFIPLDPPPGREPAIA